MPYFSASLHFLAATAGLAMAYPVPMGQSIEPGSLTKPEGEVITVDEDRAQRMTVPVSIEGRGPFSFVIDTGAERTVLSRKLATKLQLSPEEPAKLMSIAGSSMVDMVYVPELTLGSTSYGSLIAPVLLAHHIGAEGILGLDSLQNQRILFDFTANQISVENTEKPLEMAKNREIVVTARRRSGQLIFTEATISGLKVNVIVDTGAQISIANPVLKKRLIQRAKEEGKENSVIAVTGETLGVKFGIARDFRIGRAYFETLPLAFADAPPFKLFGLDNKPALLLGMDILRKFDQVAIDFKNRKIHFLLPKNIRHRYEANRSSRF